MDKLKILKKPIIIDIRKPLGVHNTRLNGNDGKIANEGHQVKYVNVIDFDKFIVGVRRQGYSLIEVVSYGESNVKKENAEIKEIVDAKLASLNPKSEIAKDNDSKVLDLIQEQVKVNEELKKKIEELEKAANKVDSKNNNTATTATTETK